MNSKIFFCVFKPQIIPERRDIDYEFRLKTAQQQEIQNDTMSSWESLETFFNKLGAHVINNGNSLILAEVHGVRNFNITLFLDLKGFRKFNTAIR